MSLTFSVLKQGVTSDRVREAVLTDDGRIRVLPAATWLSFSWDEVRLFMHEYPIYVLPTEELISDLRALISPYKRTIEIGAGTGNVGRALGVRMTDSRLQERPEIKLYYAMAGQPTITYPSDVMKADALSAVRILKPDCVFGCYVTHYSEDGAGSSWGVKFDKILPKVRRLILVGNPQTHGANPIMKCYHKEIINPGKIITRSGAGPDNTIYVWGDLGNLLF